MLTKLFVLLKDILRQCLDHDIGPAIAHFLNCFMGKVLGAYTKGSLSNAQSKTLKVCLPKLGILWFYMQQTQLLNFVMSQFHLFYLIFRVMKVAKLKSLLKAIN